MTAPVAPVQEGTASAPARRVGILGGTGDLGRGLALRASRAGFEVMIGSRDGDRAADVAGQLAFEAGRAGGIVGADNARCADWAEVVFVAVPYAGHADLLRGLVETLAGKIVIDCVNPLGFDAQGCYPLGVPEGSASLQAQAILAGSTVVSAFHTVSARLLLDPALDAIETDVLVLGDDRAATDLVQAMVTRFHGMRGIYGGRLRNSRQVEALTANLISINRRYKVHAGIRISDL